MRLDAVKELMKSLIPTLYFTSKIKRIQAKMDKVRAALSPSTNLTLRFGFELYLSDTVSYDESLTSVSHVALSSSRLRLVFSGLARQADSEAESQIPKGPVSPFARGRALSQARSRPRSHLVL